MNRIVLWGFMGSGKTTVGKLLAQYLGWKFVDVDEEICRRTGKSIPEFFQQQGEEAFRTLESRIIRSLSHRSKVVIAPGGGAVMEMENVIALQPHSLMVHLSASPETLLQRLKKVKTRPLLLKGKSVRQNILRLLALRQPSYDRIPFRVHTDDKTPVEVAREILTLLPSRMEELTPKSSRLPTKVCLGRGITAHLGDFLKMASCTPKVLFLSDPKVPPFFRLQAKTSLFLSNFQVHERLFSSGEELKNLSIAQKIWSALFEIQADRRTPVVVMGGGTLTDVAGFAASTFLRGLPLILIPTTLLAQVDASIGGKNALHFHSIINQIGTFYFPAIVLIDPLFLLDLPEKEIQSGMAEAVKAGIVANPSLFAFIQKNAGGIRNRNLRVLEKVIRSAVGVKMRVVEEDPYEKGTRRVLNLGHTFAHALVSAYPFLSHGEAVSIGLVLSARLSSALRQASPSLAKTVVALLKKLKLPTSPPPRFSSNPHFQRALSLDKKRKGEILTLVLPVQIGKVRLAPVHPSALLKFLRCKETKRPIKGNEI